MSEDKLQSSTRVYENILNESKDVQKVFAKQFSEDSQGLENLLLLLWENKINTRGCCAGHEDEEFSDPYVAFELDKIPTQRLRNLLIELCDYGVYESISYMSKSSTRAASLSFHLKRTGKAENERHWNDFYDILSRTLFGPLKADYYNQKYRGLKKESRMFVDDVVKVDQIYFSKIDLSKYNKSLKQLPSLLRDSLVQCIDLNHEDSEFAEFGILEYETGFIGDLSKTIKPGEQVNASAMNLKRNNRNYFIELNFKKSKVFSRESLENNGKKEKREYYYYLKKLFPHTRETFLKLYEMAKAQGALTPEGLAAQENGQMGE